ncbi:Isoflavone reductase [Pleurostoma richardsiae]|uniref:Isoflavone reductase n=1 Tax=Pleurostoma richardsiae TaxID=41990 RepID=A0AA38RF81_9PEZI|nr:Isoflavone reductase [Pleurostoma richardsiae]
MTTLKVIVVGASGETGGSIVNGLLESQTKFDVVALTRPASVGRPENDELRRRGVQVLAAELEGPEDELVSVLSGADVVISAVNAMVLHAQVSLANAAKRAGVGRFVPCCFGTIAPPKGVMQLRDRKEDIINHVKKLYLPYTVIDVGWWYQITLPRLPSGRIDYALAAPASGIPGDGNTPTSLTDLRDVGRYVAHIISDPKTLNKMVFAYNEVLTLNDVYDLLEKRSGETVDRNYVPKDKITVDIAKAQQKMAQQEGQKSLADYSNLWTLEYRYSWGIRGDNIPERARYLGYLDCRELYPDLKWTRLDDYVTEVLDGKARRVFARRSA